MAAIAWGKAVPPIFVSHVQQICRYLRIDPSWLMAAMAFETGETFDPAVRNAAGSGAVGLIQFLPATCAALGVTPDEVAAMSAADQLGLVLRFFQHWAGKLSNLGDVYGVILWPAMVGKPDDFVVFSKDDPAHPKRYLQNHGLDFNADGVITRAEIVARVQAELERGLEDKHVLEA